MIVKFETKSKRVKGLAFHPIRPWLLSALHSGTIQLWDYRLKTLLEEFDGHEGAVRGIDFHPSQSLFVSGGDDFKIHVWNYKQRKCLFTMKGHLDFVRTVQFHPELPWIVSASDDQTIRIWNWQNRQMISILTGHSHYVMCARFHPTQDLLASCSLDQTIRIWDFSSARKNQSKQTKFGTNDVEVHSVLETHERGVNWCEFHPKEDLLVSASDDRKIKLWKFNESRAWDYDTLYGHKNNVSSAAFHPRLNLIISNSEDKTTKVWDMNRRVAISTFSRESDRFWVVAVHPQNLTFASGCDNGFYVFSLFSDKMPQQISTDPSNYVLYAFRRQILAHNFTNKSSIVAKELESNVSALVGNISEFQQNPFESGEIQFLVGKDLKDKALAKFHLLRYNTTSFEGISKAREELNSFSGRGAVFVSKNKIARITESREVEIYNFDLNTQSNLGPEIKDVNKVFPGPIGNVIFSTDESLILYNITTKKEMGKLPMKQEYRAKNVAWNKNNQMVALTAKKSIHIMNKNLGKICSFSEKFNVKSLIWSGNVIIYTTINHLKFGLLNGDSGIIKCIDENLKAVKLEGNVLFAINPAAEVIQITLNLDELLLKKSLFDKNWEKIKYYVDNNTNNKHGNSVISYLHKKNYSGIALNLVTDPKTKFSLAINSGNLEQAFKSALELKDKEIWGKLADEAKRQGNHQIVEIAYQNIKEYEKLSFLYVTIGKTEYLKRMLDISQKRGDIMSRFSNALFLGDIEERIKILADSNQIALAYYMAVAHNKPELAEPLKKALDHEPNLEQLKKYKMTALVPPKPLVKVFESSAQASRNWPQNHIPEEYMVVLADQDSNETAAQNLPENAVQQNIVDEEPNQGNNESTPATKTSAGTGAQKDRFEANGSDEEDTTENAWPDDGDLIDDEDEPEAIPEASSAPTPIASSSQAVVESKLLKSVKQSLIPANHVVFGFFENSFSFWKKQLGIYNFQPLMQEALKVATSSLTVVSSIPYVSSSLVNIHANNKPFICRSFANLETLLKKAQKATSEGKFADAEKGIRDVLTTIPFVKVTKESEVNELKQLIQICYQYLVAMLCELRKITEPARSFELTAYMAICNLKPVHRVLALRAAMNAAFKLGNFIYSSYFAKKLIRVVEANPNSAKPDVTQTAEKVLRKCETQGTNATQIVFDDVWLYDDDSAFYIDPSTMAINKNIKEAVKCPYCTAKVDKIHLDSICPLCNLGKIGAQVIGLKLDL